VDSDLAWTRFISCHTCTAAYSTCHQYDARYLDTLEGRPGTIGRGWGANVAQGAGSRFMSHYFLLPRPPQAQGLAGHYFTLTYSRRNTPLGGNARHLLMPPFIAGDLHVRNICHRSRQCVTCPKSESCWRWGRLQNLDRPRPRVGAFCDPRACTRTRRSSFAQGTPAILRASAPQPALLGSIGAPGVSLTPGPFARAGASALGARGMAREKSDCGMESFAKPRHDAAALIRNELDAGIFER
jgi:hypothetical protein